MISAGRALIGDERLLSVKEASKRVIRDITPFSRRASRSFSQVGREIVNKVPHCAIVLVLGFQSASLV